VSGIKLRLQARSRVCTRARLATVLCLAIALPLVQAGPALALSGYASDKPAVNAQYPDAGGLDSDGPGGGSVITLGSLMHSKAQSTNRPRAVAVQRKVRRAIQQQAKPQRATLSSATSLGPTQSASFVLLLGAIGVASVASILRWRRRLAGV
jgi:hypothetical protein